MTIQTAMVLAAGLGTRMAPLTDTMPKPMVPVAGRPIIDHILDKLVTAGVERAVVNVHYMADSLQEHLADRSDIEIVISDERAALMDSGGGVAQALKHLGDQPFLVLNADALWVEGVRPALDRLAAAWDPDHMDGLMLIANIATATGYSGLGDFTMDPLGRLSWREERQVAPFVFTGVQIFTPSLFADAPREPFPIRRIWDAAMERKRLFGLRHDARWLHIGTPSAIRPAEIALGDF